MYNLVPRFSPVQIKHCKVRRAWYHARLSLSLQLQCLCSRPGEDGNETRKQEYLQSTIFRTLMSLRVKLLLKLEASCKQNINLCLRFSQLPNIQWFFAASFSGQLFNCIMKNCGKEPTGNKATIFTQLAAIPLDKVCRVSYLYVRCVCIYICWYVFVSS